MKLYKKNLKLNLFCPLALFQQNQMWIEQILRMKYVVIEKRSWKLGLKEKISSLHL